MALHQLVVNVALVQHLIFVNYKVNIILRIKSREQQCYLHLKTPSSDPILVVCFVLHYVFFCAGHFAEADELRRNTDPCGDEVDVQEDTLYFVFPYVRTTFP